MENRKHECGREEGGKLRGEGIWGGSGMGGGGGYGHSTGGLNFGAQHFNNRYMTDISEATKSRTGTRRIIAHSDHQQMITSNSRHPPTHHKVSVHPVFQFHPAGTLGARDSFGLVARELG